MSVKYVYDARAMPCFVQDLAELVNVSEGSGVGVPLPGVGHPLGQKAETCHVAAARNLPLALGALQGLVRHLGLLEDASNHGTFSLTIGEQAAACQPRAYIQYAKRAIYRSICTRTVATTPIIRPERCESFHLLFHSPQ